MTANAFAPQFHLALSPASLALVLEAVGPTALRRAGAILAERMKARAAEGQTPAEGQARAQG
jgi:hypothetical protein